MNDDFKYTKLNKMPTIYRKKWSFFDKSNTEEDHWPAFTDLFGSVVLFLFLVLMFFLLHLKKSEDKVKKQEAELRLRTIKLGQQENEIRKLNEQLNLRFKQISISQSQREFLRKELTELIKKEELLKKQLTDVSKQKQGLEHLKNIAISQRMQCEQKIKDYVGVRRRIIQEVVQKLQSKLEQPDQVRFDMKGGSIILGAHILFPTGSAYLNTSGKDKLRQIWKFLDEVLSSPENQPYIAGVLIEGYSSSEGETWSNWKLSTTRALAALQFLLKNGAKKWSDEDKIAATGYGPTRTVKNSSQEEDRERSRRIALRILFLDRKQLEKLAEQINPSNITK